MLHFQKYLMRGKKKQKSITKRIRIIIKEERENVESHLRFTYSYYYDSKLLL